MVEAATSPLAVMFDTSTVFTSNITGFALYDPVKDSMIYGQNEARYFTPASNTKLFTFYTGLKILPDSLPALEYVIRGDSLIIWGTGDPSFLHPDFGVDTVYNFLKNSNRTIYYSDSHFNDKRLGPGWAWDDYNYYYSTEKSPLPMYGNFVRFKVQEVEVEELAKTDEGFAVSPAYFRSTINEMPEADGPLLYRDVDENSFAYKPEADTVTYTIDKPYHYTPELIVNLLSDTLHKPVQYIEMEKPDSAKMLYSIPTDTAFKRMLKPSDNFIAEQLLYVAASQLGMPLETERVIEYMQKNYLGDLPDEPQWADGSGLSRYNLFTPRSMIRLLEKISAEFDYDENLFALLPAGGESGTISNLYANRDGGSPYVFAKTGTLSNNHCLTGFIITETGRKLLFSFMNNHYVTPTYVVQNEMEKILWYIHENL
ncbi:MAG TPA: D-alanyl-D-alanine carboxypeptidase [Balneolaceae bacterium]|nr:D-alanyl-D-alanine carboxypeptidase [Balneolaceae bacterium]